MNRENKRKQYQNHYYKIHRCDDTFTCKHCGRVIVPIGAGTQHRNHCPNCLTSLHLDDEPGDRAADDNPMMLMSIAMRPLCAPPFPLERIEEMTALMGGEGSMR